ncbi:hypothetical protein Bca52824_063349 [Brassica carinata]|uniref:Uncharacterized protein n=1 Tax=Brassica carinata TaxID=52824 RepID=A0A8X7QJM3_BRACI|nr:hypothetical protein Bca52824_063349 [Brassica carinata]
MGRQKTKRSLLQLRNIGNATPLSHVRISATFPVPEKPGSLISATFLHRAPVAAVGESSPAIIRPQSTPAVTKKSKLSQTTVRRRSRSSGEELGALPAKTAALSGHLFELSIFLLFVDSGSEDGPGGGDSSGGQFSDGLSVHFIVIPDEERLLLVDQNEDRQVTSLVQKLLFAFPKFKVPGAAGEELVPLPYAREICDRVIQRPLKLKIFLLLETAEKRIANCREVSEQEEPTLIERESGHLNDDDQAKENEVRQCTLPPSAETKAISWGWSAARNTINALALFGDVLDVESESYVLPAEHAVTSPGAWQKRNPTYRYEQGSPRMGENKAELLQFVGSVRSFHPSWDGNPSSKSKEDPDGGEEARTADKQPQSVDSVETSNMEFPKSVEAVGIVAPPKAGGEASFKEINAELQGTEDEERYDSCKDDMSTDSKIQENPRDMCGKTDADSKDVGSGAKFLDVDFQQLDGASDVDMLYAVNDSNFGIPDRCPCGSAIIIQISTEAAAIPKKYFVCKDFKNDGLHRKQEWTAIED